MAKGYSKLVHSSSQKLRFHLLEFLLKIEKMFSVCVVTLGDVIGVTKIIEKTGSISVKLSASAISRIVVPSNR